MAHFTSTLCLALASAYFLASAPAFADNLPQTAEQSPAEAGEGEAATDAPEPQALKPKPAPRPSQRLGTTVPDKAEDPDACSTCGTGLLALGITASAPLTLAGALGLLAANQAGWIQNDPLAGFGIPLWGAGLGCAGVHIFFAVVTAVAFGRDFKALLDGDDDIDSEQSNESKPKKAPLPKGPKPQKVQQPGLAIDAQVQRLAY